MFEGCSSLSSIKIPEKVTDIGSYAFRNCRSLKSIFIPQSVRYIGYSCFNNCTGMTSVTLRGGSLMYRMAFNGCSSLTDVTCFMMTPPVISQDNETFYPACETATLHVPQDAVERYRNDNGWRYFTNIVGIPGKGPGDVNGDGSLDVDDVTDLIGMLLNGEELPAYADVNGDGLADIDDVTLLITTLLNAN